MQYGRLDKVFFYKKPSKNTFSVIYHSTNSDNLFEAVKHVTIYKNMKIFTALNT